MASYKTFALALGLSGVVLLGLTEPALAQQALPGIQATPTPGGGTNYSVSIQTMLFFTFLSFIPAIVLMMTSFTRIVIVLSLLRMALGTQNSPPNQIIIGLALFLSFFVMSPTLDRVYNEAYVPYEKEELQFTEMLDKAVAPMKDFMINQVREPDLALFKKLAKIDGPIESAADLPLRVIVPAFITSELKTAFQIGFMVFLPFLVIDLIVSSVLMSMGMMMLSPMLISLPFKLMLFVLADGWTLLTASLVSSFAVN